MALDHHDLSAVPRPLLTEKELWAKIEVFARKRYRKQLYDLARELPEDTRKRVLVAIVEAHHAFAGTGSVATARKPERHANGRGRTSAGWTEPRARKIDAADYHRARERLEAQLEVLHHPLIKGFSPEGGVEFFSREEAICPHRDWTWRCQQIQAMSAVWWKSERKASSS